MAYEFNAGEPIPAAVKRLALEQIERIAEHLDAADDPLEKRVHSARKRMKEMRALLRLLREPLGDEFAIENVWFRDAGRELASVREAAAMVEAIGKLRKHERDPSVRRRLSKVSRTLQQHSDDVDLAARIERLLAELPNAKARVKQWPKLPDRFSTIEGGLRRTYRDGRRAFTAVRKLPSPERFHELRKRVKDHWYHAQLLRPLWPEMLQSYAKHVEQLSDVLGDHHDLIVIAQTAAKEPARFGSEADLRVLLGAVERRRAKLEEEALDLASRVYSEKPRAWSERVRAYWRVSRSLSGTSGRARR